VSTKIFAKDKQINGSHLKFGYFFRVRWALNYGAEWLTCFANDRQLCNSWDYWTVHTSTYTTSLWDYLYTKKTCKL